MCKVDIIVTTETTKVRNNALTGLDAIIMECPALPLGKAKGDLQLGILKVARGKGGRSFDAVEVVVET